MPKKPIAVFLMDRCILKEFMPVMATITFIDQMDGFLVSWEEAGGFHLTLTSQSKGGKDFALVEECILVAAGNTLTVNDVLSVKKEEFVIDGRLIKLEVIKLPDGFVSLRIAESNS